MTEHERLRGLSDDALLAALDDAVAARAEDDRRRDAARSAFTWRTVDTELATLLHDSALDAGAAVRSTAVGRRTLSFELDGLTLELEVAEGALIGEVIGGAGAATVTVQRPDAADLHVTTDAAGFFRLDSIGAGVVRFRVRAGDVALTTEWTTL